MKKILLTTIYWLLTTFLQAQLTTPKNTFTQADTLRGSNNANRDWWDVLRYDITVKPDFEKKEIKGVVRMEVLYNKLRTKMQIDLDTSFVIDSAFIIYNGRNIDNIYNGRDTVIVIDSRNKVKIKCEKYYNCFLYSEIPIFKSHSSSFKILTYYHGKPKEAKKAPWDGGWVWAKDKLGRPFVSVACQGLGASCWFPCKDIQSDEPQDATLTVVLPDSIVGVANGHQWDMKYRNPIFENGEWLSSTNIVENVITKAKDSSIYNWCVLNPINTYCIVPYIGNYVNFTDTFVGEKGTLDLSYWVLDYNKEKAEEQFKEVKPMLKAFEYWFGAYPFYEDGYKLVEAPYLGMEHQSAIAYGNGFQNGYKGRDLSGSGWGLKWDFIIVHESGHEWFANSITTNDIADMWVHEGFTNYSEVLFTEYYYGKEAGNDYCYGLRKNIVNDIPVIGPYGVNKEGSGDMYWKAANMIHSIRNALNNDKKFRQILRGMNEKFYHKTVDGSEIEQYLINETGLVLQKTFDQYLRTTQIPTFEYYFKGKKLFYKYSNCIDGFNMPITIPSTNKRIIPSTSWQRKRLNKKNKEWFTIKNVERLYLLKMNNVENEIK